MGRIKGYKVFGPGWICDPAGTPFRYAVGETYEMEEVPIVCKRGFHFCGRAADCFNYYDFDPKNKVAEIEALGDIDSDGSISCTNKIHIIREIPWQEILDLVNTGNGCTGIGNSGNRNSGDCNSGNRNSGDWNSGNWNSGDWNSGDWNTCNHSNSCFNTQYQNIYLFNKPSNWTYNDWFNSRARKVLKRIAKQCLTYVMYDKMSDQEKEQHPEAKTTGGYLKVIDNPDVQRWWVSLSDDDKKVILSIPNFDKAIFKEITGIDVDKN